MFSVSLVVKQPVRLQKLEQHKDKVAARNRNIICSQNRMLPLTMMQSVTLFMSAIDLRTSED